MFDKKLKLSIYEAIKKQGNFLGIYSKEDGIMSFLSRIWPLRSMPSEDPRFTNAYDDAFKHLVNNDDWDTDHTFLDRFKLIEGNDEYFNKFIELVVDPEIRENLEDIQRYVGVINNLLRDNVYSLVLNDYLNELPVYKISEKKKDLKRPIGIRNNKIPFFKELGKIDKYPCFLIMPNDWDDYGSKTTFHLSYYENVNNSRTIGRVKIMKKEVNATAEVLEDKFLELGVEFCSLGQEESYYFNLQKSFPEDYQSILLALRDSAVFTRIYELFERDTIYKSSLIRDNKTENIRRTIRFELLGDQKVGYKFSYVFKPLYDTNDDGAINLYFDLDQDPGFPQRIVALIGKNGTGKTTILNGLINHLRSQNPENFVPKKPIFSKYFTVSYSVFDRFEPPIPDVEFNYIYCGLKKSLNTIKSLEEQQAEFYIGVEEIKKRELEYDWYQILKTFLSDEHLDLMFPHIDEDFKMAKFNLSEFKSIQTYFSSGESILLFILTKIVSEIRNNSLILYDEPETHLHPNAISDLMSALSTLLNKFDSYCILATHSPIVIRELNSSNVIVLKRNGNGLEIQPLAIDSFGQNLTVITEEIFGNKDAQKLFLERIKLLVDENKSFEQIIDILKSGNIPVNLNTRLYIKTLIGD